MKKRLLGKTMQRIKIQRYRISRKLRTYKVCLQFEFTKTDYSYSDSPPYYMLYLRRSGKRWRIYPIVAYSITNEEFHDSHVSIQP